MLSLDSGGVLTVQGGPSEKKHDGLAIWKASVPGAYGLAQLFKLPRRRCRGSEQQGQLPAAEPRGPLGISRHAASLGIEHVYLVDKIGKKADISSRVKATLVVDDRKDALAAQARGAWHARSLEEAFLFGGRRAGTGRNRGLGVSGL